MPDKNVQLTFVYSYYNQPEMSRHIERRINSYDEAIRSDIEVIVVDDGSKSAPLALLSLDCASRFFRIRDDIGFNNGGAKNVGITHAAGLWCVLMDLDHWFDIENISALYRLSRREDGSRWFQFSRLRDGIARGVNPNLKMAMRDNLASNLYDEDFSGNYGYEDIYQSYMLSRELGPPTIPEGIFVHETIEVPDANTISITKRRLATNKRLLERKIAGEVPYSRHALRTPYDEIQSRNDSDC
ncbi:MAG: glycosyltransferase family A protein [Rectinemataceae bacterium]|jgi:glycosyltransferase involved in cell wall biosynthesis